MNKLLTLLILCSLTVSCSSPNQDELLKEWETMNMSKSTSYEVYNDLKFGMFIHWGVYSALGGIWNEKQIPSIGEWIMYNAQIPRAEYQEIAKKFNPTGFNADEWVRLAKEAGMKYIVAMAKHHDGFSMYRSNITDFNIYDYTPFQHDPIEELYQACQKYEIRLGLYYSHSIDWMDGGDAGNAQYKKMQSNNGDVETKDNLAERLAANIWDPSPATYENYIEKKAKPQMREILTKFPSLIEVWYDFSLYMNFQQSYDFYKLVFDIQPNCLINSRVGNDLGDILTAGDNEIPTEVDSKHIAWETAGTINDTWGFKSYDHNWKSTKEMLFWLVDIASKGGNYLLNVGPDGNGVIPEESARVLKGIGEWMKINGEAIYGTHKWTTEKEGPTSLEMRGTEYRANKEMDFPFTNEDFWFTAKDNYLYVISLTNPTNNIVSVKSLYASNQNIKSVQVLGVKEFLEWKATDGKVDITLPKGEKVNETGFVLKVELN